MSFKASGTLRSVLTLCIALSATILPVLSAPAPTGDTSPWVPRSLKSLFEPRATGNKCGGTGLYITNSGSGSQTYTIFEGKWSITSNPYKSVTLAGGKSAPVTLPSGFVGHVQRGSLLPATWVELNMVAGAADGDVSLEIGCDGAVQVQASAWGEGGAPPVFGFKQDIVTGAPADTKWQGETLGGSSTTGNHAALDATGTLATGVKNQNTLTYVQGKLSQTDAYLWGGTGTGQAIASDNCLLVTFY